MSHLGSIPSRAGTESLKNAWPSRGCGACTTVRYGLRILHCYLPPDLGHSAGLREQEDGVMSVMTISSDHLA